MTRDKFRKFFFNNPILLHGVKVFLSNKFVANSRVYKKIVMKRAKRFADKSVAYKKSISVETTLNCNSRCIFCAHYNKILTGTMSKDLYERLIDECQELGIKNIDFGVYGEFLTDKFMFERIDYLKKYGMTYGFITNASLLSSEITDRLLKMKGLACVNFSVNGFSREVYEKTMIGLNRDVTYKNILYFLNQKEKLKIKDLEIIISAVRTKYNKKDLGKFFRFWRRQKGVSIIFAIELMDRMGREYKGEIGNLGAMEKKTNWLSPCKYLWEPLRVYYDGKVSSCCKEDYRRSLIIGDFTKQTLKEILEGESLKNLRNLHLSGNRQKHLICGKCYLNSVWIG